MSHANWRTLAHHSCPLARSEENQQEPFGGGAVRDQLLGMRSLWTEAWCAGPPRHGDRCPSLVTQGVRFWGRGRGMQVWPGEAYPLGATYDGAGTNFAVFTQAADR